MSEGKLKGRRVRVGTMAECIAPLANVKATLLAGRALGADDLWFGDHQHHIVSQATWNTLPISRLVPNPNHWFDPTSVIARYGRKRGPALGTMVTDPIRRSPGDLARAWLSLHHLTGGNVILGIGSGEGMNCQPLGLSMSRSVTRLEDALSAIRAVWEADGKPLTHSGPFHSWQDVTFLPSRRGSVPPIWVAAQGPKACGVAGRWGDGWIHLHSEFKNWRQAATNVAKGAEAAGKDPAGLDCSLVLLGVLTSKRSYYEKVCAAPIVRAVALGLSAAEWAAAGAQHPFGENYRGPQDAGIPFEGEEYDEASRLVTPDLVERLMPCGSAETVADYLSQFVDQGVSHVMVINFAPASSFEVAADSLRVQRRLNTILKGMRPGTLVTRSEPVVPVMGSAASGYRG